MIEHIFFFVLFGILGISAEIFGTSIHSFIKKKDKAFRGHSSLWMFFIYGSSYFIILFATSFFMNFNILIRGLIYMILLYALEFGSGFILKKFKAMPWNYSKLKYNFKGIVCIECAPLWFAGGIILEKIYFYLRSLILG